MEINIFAGFFVQGFVMRTQQFANKVPIKTKVL